MKKFLDVDKTLYDSCDTYAQKFIIERLTKEHPKYCLGDDCIQDLCRNCKFYDRDFLFVE